MGATTIIGIIGRYCGKAIRGYFKDHQNPKTRFWHTVGTVAGAGTAAGALVSGCPPEFAIPSALPVTYAFAIPSHKYEGNKPSTFKRPWEIPFFIIGDIVMSGLTLVGLDKPVMRWM